MAAVIGQVVPLALWATVGATTEAALLPLVEQAIEARVLDATPDGLAVRFAHALIREALYEGVLPPRRRVWHRRIGEALVIQGPAPDPDMVAYHLSQAVTHARCLADARGRAGPTGVAWRTATLTLRGGTALEGDDSA
jgi:hypothetical protein